MSLIPEIGHLYHDFSISNAYTTLDAQEQLRTRQINAREDKQLGKFSDVIDKAKVICKRRREWEEEAVRRQLRVIQTKTPSLDRGLRQETERLRRYESSLMSRNNTCDILSQSRMTTATERASLASRQWASKSLLSSHISYKSPQGSESLRTYTSNTDSSSGSQGQRSDHNYDNQVNFVKRAEHVTKELHKLYRRQKERKSTKHHLMELIRFNNKELLMKSRTFFKDSDATAVLESILTNKDLEHSNKNGVTFHDDILRHNTVANETNDDVFTLLNDDTGDVMHDRGRSAENDHVTYPQGNNISDTESGPVSSTVANASDGYSEISRVRMKWTEIFKTPELWKVYRNIHNSRSEKKEEVSPLVTITAKYRRTMVK